MSTVEKRDRILLLYGKAAFQAQLLEEQMIQLLLDQKWTSDTMPAKLLSAEEQKLRKLPLGALLKLFSKEFPKFTAYADYVETVKKSRDYLAHRFFVRRGFHFDWGSDYSMEQRELEEIRSNLAQCTGSLEKFRESIAEWKKSRTSR